MTQEIIETNENNDNSAVSVGDNQMVSMQMVQDVYNEITGKTEEISKNYRLHHKTSFEDIEQLNLKIMQLYEQYNIIESNCNVTLYHVDDCKETYSSFERFKMFDRSSLSPVENIHIQYNFLILLPKTNRPQNYKIEVDIHSRAAIKQKQSTEHGISRRIIHIIAVRTAMLEIEYIDYTVARNFRTAIDSWFHGLEQSKSSKILEFSQDNSIHFYLLARYLSALFICAYFYLNFGGWIEGQLTLEKGFKLGILCFGTVYILSGIAGRIGGEMTRSVESIQPISYLKLNRGDDKAISELEQSIRKNKSRIFGGLLLAVLLNIASAWIAAKLGIGM